MDKIKQGKASKIFPAEVSFPPETDASDFGIARQNGRQKRANQSTHMITRLRRARLAGGSLVSATASFSCSIRN